MIKKLFIILCILAFWAVSFAGIIDMHKAVIARKNVTAVTYDYHGSDAQPADQSNETGVGSTYIFDEASTVAGYIIKIEVYVHDESGGVFDFGIFSKSTLDFTDEHTVSGLAISNGLNTFTHADSDFDASDLPISIGEYIGWIITSDGSIDKKDTGGPGYFFLFGDHIDGTPDDETYELSANTGHENQIRVYISSEDP